MLTKNIILALGLTAFATAQTSIEECPENNAFVPNEDPALAGTCVECLDGEVPSPTGGETCVEPTEANQCPANTFFDDSLTPAQCRNFILADCAEDQVLNSMGARPVCQTCEDPQVANQDRDMCITPDTIEECSANGQILPPGAAECESCVPGETPVTEGETAFTECRALESEDCSGNSVLGTDSEGFAACEDCTDGEIADRTTTPETCRAPLTADECAIAGDRFRFVAGEPNTCEDCGEGFTPDATTGTECIADGDDTEEPPAEETPAEETPAEETPVEETPVEETPVEETPVEETPVEETPVEETPVVTPPVNETTPVIPPVNETTPVVPPANETTTTTEPSATPLPTGVRDGIPEDSVCEFGQEYVVDGEQFFEACENVITGIRYAAEETATDEACAAGCAADVNNTINACVGWSRDATTGVCSLFNFIESVAVPASDLAASDDDSALRRRQDIITVPGDRAGFPVGALPDFEALPTTTPTTITVTANGTATVTATTTEVVCVRPGVCVPVYPTSVPFTKTYLVPCPTGFEEKVTTVYVGHCGCPQTPVPTAPVVTVITTVIPDGWKVPGGPTQVVTLPVDGPRAPTDDERLATITADGSKVVVVPTAGATADAGKGDDTVVVVDSGKGGDAGKDADAGKVGDAVPTYPATIRTEAAAPNPTAPVKYTGGASGHIVGGGIVGAIAAFAAAIML